MANIKSAKKRILVAKARNERNKAAKSAVKTAMKKVEAAGQKAAAASPVPIADFFNLRGFETVDMRPKGGAFWVIGERAEIKDIVEEASKLYHLTVVIRMAEKQQDIGTAGLQNPKPNKSMSPSPKNGHKTG